MSILSLRLVIGFHQRIASFLLERPLSVTQGVSALPGLLAWHSRCGFVIGRSRMGGITASARNSLTLVRIKHEVYSRLLIVLS